MYVLVINDEYVSLKKYISVTDAKLNLIIALSICRYVLYFLLQSFFFLNVALQITNI